MANKLKQGATGTEADSIFKGDWAINTTEPNIGGGPSIDTGFYTGAHIPDGGYVIYYLNEAYTAINDADLLGRVKGLGGDGSSVSAALAWAAAEPSIVILDKAFNNEVANGLVLKLDSNNISSFTDSEPTTNLITTEGLDFSLMSTYGSLGLTQLVDSNSPSGYACEMELIDGGFINSASRSRFGYDTNMPTSGNVFVSIWARFAGGPASEITPRVFTGAVWQNLEPLDGGLTYLTSNYRRFGAYTRLGTGSGGPNPGFSMTNGNSNKQTGQKTRWHSPQVELKDHVTPFVDGIRLQNTELYDLSSFNNHATLTTGPTFHTNGWINFDGTQTNDHQIAVPINRAQLGDQMSIEATFKYEGDAASGYRPIIGGNDPGRGTEFFLGKNSGNNRFGVQDGNYSGSFVSDYDVFDGRWHHMLYTYNEGIGKLYLDGVLRNTGSFSKANDSEQIYIGAEVQEGYWWHGNISQIKYYTQALDATSNKQNYYQAPIVTDGLAAHYDASNIVSYDGTGDTIWRDMSGNGYDLELINGPIWEKRGYFNNDADSYFTGPGGSEIPTGNDPYTMIVWARQVGEWGNSDGFISIGGFGTNNGSNALRTLSNSAGNFHHYWWYTDLSLNSNAANVNVGDWFMVAASFDGNTRTVWVNGIARTSDNPGSGHNVTSSTIQLSKTVGAEYQVGDIAGASIYNRCLSADEMLQNFNAQRNRFSI